jgi:hypothetical protein
VICIIRPRIFFINVVSWSKDDADGLAVFKAFLTFQLDEKIKLYVTVP